jgi:hypothetical protein
MILHKLLLINDVFELILFNECSNLTNYFIICFQFEFKINTVNQLRLKSNFIGISRSNFSGWWNKIKVSDQLDYWQYIVVIFGEINLFMLYILYLCYKVVLRVLSKINRLS